MLSCRSNSIHLPRRRHRRVAAVDSASASIGRRFVGHGVPAALFCLAAIAARHGASGDKFCGETLEAAQALCWQPCSVDTDCCSSGTWKCFETGSACGSSDLSGPNHRFCGTSWCDAAFKCGTPCPTLSGCPEGESCYGDTPCTVDDIDATAPPLPPPLTPPGTLSGASPSARPTESPSEVPGTTVQTVTEPNAPPASQVTRYCGGTPWEAANLCWQPCRDDDDCCGGLTCHSVTECSIPINVGPDHYFCGSDYCDASYNCNDRVPCPSGDSSECPDGQLCTVNTPCNANVQAERSTHILRHGLPQRAVDLYRRYDLLGGYDTYSGHAAKSGAFDSRGGSLQGRLHLGLSLVACLRLVL